MGALSAADVRFSKGFDFLVFGFSFLGVSAPREFL